MRTIGYRGNRRRTRNKPSTISRSSIAP
jgi:hypothetical protein